MSPVTRRTQTILAVLLICASASLAAAQRKHAAKPTVDIDVLRLQVALDRAHFSVGEIDGRPGAKTQKALAAFQEARGLPLNHRPDNAVWDALGNPAPTTPYRVSEEDVAGPFTPDIPKDLEQQGGLDRLGYRTPLELLSERFHASPRLIERLNPKKPTFAAGDIITVPNVDPLVLPATTGKRRDAKRATNEPDVVVTVFKERNDLTVRDAAGTLLLYAPVSSGSQHDPLPIGDWIIRGVYFNPTFHYNPDLFWDAEPTHAKTKIAAGPNNPVGVAWLDLNRDHYGLHGTPEPSSVGVTQSHGCVRLTNWDVVRVADLVREGTRVEFRSTMDTAAASAPPSPDPPPSASASGDVVQELRARRLTMPVVGLAPERLTPTFAEMRGNHPHEALDMLAARGVPVVAVEDGTIAKLFWSKQGGHTIYHFDPSRRFAYYYAHLDRYADGLREGQAVTRGQTIGYVGSTGNASAEVPHLHFAIFQLTPEKQWWKGTPIDPYPVLRWALDPSP